MVLRQIFVVRGARFVMDLWGLLEDKRIINMDHPDTKPILLVQFWGHEIGLGPDGIWYELCARRIPTFFYPYLSSNKAQLTTEESELLKEACETFAAKMCGCAVEGEENG